MTIANTTDSGKDDIWGIVHKKNMENSAELTPYESGTLMVKRAKDQIDKISR